MSSSCLDPTVWQVTTSDGAFVGRCRICNVSVSQPRHCARHEQSASHQRALLYEAQAPTEVINNLDDPTPPPDLSLATAPSFLEVIRNVQGLPAPDRQSPSPPVYEAHPDPLEFAQSLHAVPIEDADAFAAFSESTMLDDSTEDQVLEHARHLLQHHLDIEDLSSSSEAEELSDVDSELENNNTSSLNMQTGGRARSQLTFDESGVWFPWTDKITCTLDLFTHLPRSHFLHWQQDLIAWLLSVNGVQDVPSIHQMTQHNEFLQKRLGIRTIRYKSTFDNIFYMNDMGQIIAQEFANPEIRPHLHFYPEDTGGRILSEAWQADRWLKEAPDDLLTPMARLLNGDFYIYEPAMLNNGTLCIPLRWFIRDQRLHAKCWPMERVNPAAGQGWRVIQAPFDTPDNDFLMTFPELQKEYVVRHGSPDPSQIIEVIDPQSRRVQSWTYTDLRQGNPWHARAEGRRVVSQPIWLYCDDTSGNVSKKWNKHNSYLFTLASLPRAECQKEFNVHFLSTSNIVDPLEMLEAVVIQLNDIQTAGIWAWDCVLQEVVLVIVWDLAFLGDNPMQSDIACHIGLKGILFCRICLVEGKRTFEEESGNHDDADDGDDNASVASSVVETTTRAPGSSRKARRVEGLDDMIRRVSAFVKPGTPRTKDETIHQLHSLSLQARSVGTATSIKKRHTMLGLKDSYQNRFLERVTKAYQSVRGTRAKQDALDATWSSLPKNILSPVWRIKGLDPHSDTPVEILHVILLGFVKYLWRDLVHNQLKNKTAQLDELIVRLDSLDVARLGIDHLAGRTLVQYAGSLTGGNFRAIAQVAPLVLYDIAMPESFATWLSLSRLVPMIWQPVIYDVNNYLATLEQEIQNFLLVTAQWTCQWFNKPKFHLLVHLPQHIRRFGPAMLFAMEQFESFNAVIRIRSVHSNRQAPSRDIARSFAQANRVRHLLSGGGFLWSGGDQPIEIATSSAINWKTVGAGVRNLLAYYPLIARYIGLKVPDSTRREGITHVMGAPCLFRETLTAQLAINATDMGPRWANTRVSHGQRTVLRSREQCGIRQFVIYEHEGRIYLGRICEMLSPTGSVIGGILLLQYFPIHAMAHPTYSMPHARPSQTYVACDINDILTPVNVFHNCADHRCTSTGLRAVYQEREESTCTTRAMTHYDPDDVIVNVAQMHSAAVVLRFREACHALPHPEEILRNSAQKEYQLRHLASRPPLPTSRHRCLPTPGPLSLSASVTRPPASTPSMPAPSSAPAMRPPTITPSRDSGHTFQFIEEKF